MTQTIHSIHTACKKCVFAEYEDVTQKGCALQYLDVYKGQNTEILEAYDEDKEFYVINDKKCIGYREDKWFSQFGDGDLSLEDKINIYNGMNKLSYIVVINLKNLKIEELASVLDSINHADTQPQKLIFVRYVDDSLAFSYDTIEKLIEQYNVGCSWRIQTMLDNATEYGEVLHQIVMGNHQYRFFLSVSGATSSLDLLVNKANKIVHHELGQFIILSDEKKHGQLFGGSIYRFGVATNQDIFEQESNYMII